MQRPQLAGLKAIERFASLSGHAPALLSPDGSTLTFAELWDQVNAVRARLQGAGISSEDVAAVLLPQGKLQFLAVAGTLNYCVCAALPPRTTLAEVEQSLQRLSTSVLITSADFAAEADAAVSMGMTVLHAHAQQTPYEWTMQRGSGTIHAPSEFSDTALLLMTSASTGICKAVPLTIANLDAGIAARSGLLQLQASDRQLLMTSLSHIIGIENIFAQFLAGGSVIATDGFDSGAYMRWLGDLRPTWYDCAPTIHQAALERLKGARATPPFSLRFLQSAGSRLPNDVRDGLETILHVPVFNDYGMTEACPIAMDAFLPDGRIPGSAGRSCGLEIRILGANGEALPSGDDGEIVVRGPAVFSGYLDDPEATRNAFHQGWFRTGDAGRLDAQGNLFITGRLKEMINRGGEKIAPGEVDAVICSHPAVLEAAAFPVPHPTLGEDVACAIVLRSDSSHQVTAIELRRFAAERLAPFKIPRRIYFVDIIPRGELGKPKRWLLAEQVRSGSILRQPQDEVPAPLNHAAADVSYKLEEIWARILDRDDIAIDEDFFEAGGDSLAAVNMLTEVDLRFGSQTRTVAASFLDEPTLAHLTDLVGESASFQPSPGLTGEMAIFPVRDSSSGRQIFCVPGDEEEGLYFRRLATRLAGTIDLSIVRPSSSFYSWDLCTFERAGEEMTALLRKRQPSGPYIVAGYCFGGIVASEAARRLAAAGEDVQLVLFDVPMPGVPALLGYLRILLQSSQKQQKPPRESGNEKNAGMQISATPDLGRSAALPSRIVKRACHVFRFFMRRLAWTTLALCRKILVPVEKMPAIRRLIQWSQHGYFPVYKVGAVRVPMLHFLAADEPDLIDNLTRFGWRSVARQGITEHTFPHDHSNLFHESNLPGIVSALVEWTRPLPQQGKGDRTA